jgi:hypothetical protein
MAGRSILLTVLSIVLVLGAIYLIDPTIFGLLGSSQEGFADEGVMGDDANYKQPAGLNELAGNLQEALENSNPNSVGGDRKRRDASGTENFANEEDEEEGFEEEEKEEEGFANLGESAGPAKFDSAQGPAGCYPRDQLTPSELLPKDPNSVWAQQNPMGTGSLKGKNFLSAGALIGVNTVGQSLRNANHQLRSEPPNPQVPVSVFYNSTIEPDTNRRDLEIE